MKILAIRTDKPEAELYLYNGQKQLAELKWQAHRELSDTIHLKIQQILDKSSIKLEELDGLIIFRGPGSFTGLRIGATVANTLAYAYSIPIIGSLGPDWLKSGIQKLLAGQNDKIAVPEYGAEPNITKPVK